MKALLKLGTALVHYRLNRRIRDDTKLHELRFELLSYYSNLVPSRFLCSQNSREKTGRKFGNNERASAETQAYFGTIVKSYYKNGLEKRKYR